MARNSTSTDNDALSDRLDLYAEVTQTILSQMEGGTLPWTRPWKTTGAAGLPTNALTTNRYSGINVVLLWLSGAMKGYSSSRWMTYLQAMQVGGHVRRGERGTMIVKASTYVPQSERERSEGSEEDLRAVPFLKRYTVFNLDQIEGVDVPEPVVSTPIVADAALDAFVAATGADIRFGGDEAYYVPSRDYIQCPQPEAFENAFDLFRVQSHELAHWTGAVHRLDRTFGQRFGDAAYQMEELVAELAAAQICAVKGVPPTTRHAAYLQSWIKIMKADKRAIFTAARHASTAVEFLLAAAQASPVDMRLAA